MSKLKAQHTEPRFLCFGNYIQIVLSWVAPTAPTYLIPFLGETAPTLNNTLFGVPSGVSD